MRGLVFHVMNRAAKRVRLFDSEDDYLAFVRLIAQVQSVIPLPILAYCVMPNHFHFIVRPSQDDELSAFMHRMTSIHARRWNVWRKTVGIGAVYQSRFKAFPVQTDHHFLVVCRYVEQNPLRAGLVSRAEDWDWSSLTDRCKKRERVALASWPIPQPSDWVEFVNRVPGSADLAGVRRSIRRGMPFGATEWVSMAADRLNIKERGRPIGRPRS